MQDKRIALIVDKDNKVKAVPIEVRPIPGGRFYVVDSGLNPNDKMLIEGVGIVAEGTQIKPDVVDYQATIDPTKK